MSVEEYEDDYEGGGATRWVIAAVVAIVLIGGAFFAGRAMAGSGPATLAEAVQQARAGDLPCGDTGTAAAAATPPADANGGSAGRRRLRRRQRHPVRAARDLRPEQPDRRRRARARAPNGGGGRFGAAEPAGSASASPARSPRVTSDFDHGPEPPRQPDREDRPEHQGLQVLQRLRVRHQEGRHRDRRRSRRRLPPAAATANQSTTATSVLIVPSTNGRASQLRAERLAGVKGTASRRPSAGPDGLPLTPAARPAWADRTRTRRPRPS